MKKLLIILIFILLPQIAFAGVLGSFRPTSQPWNTNGLVGWWTFDGITTKTGVLKDSSGNNFNGTASGMASSTFFTQGRIGQGGNYNSNVTYTVTHNAKFNSSAITISFWARVNNTTDDTRAMDKTSTEYIVRKNGNFWQIVTNNGCDTFFNSNTTMKANVWQHWVFTADSSGCKWYLNGIVDTTTATAWTAPTGTDNLEIGSSASKYVGRLDDVRIYNRVLSATEVQQLYISGFLNPTSQNLTPLSNGLASYWNFDGYATRTGLILDQSGTNNGTLVNIATSTFYVPGRFGQALNFDGVDDRMTTSKAPGTTFTISAWVKPTAHPSAYGEVLTQNTTRGLYIKSDQRLTYFEGGDKQCTTLVKDNVWTHILVVANATYMTFWLNGVFCAANTFTVTAPTFTNTGSSNSSGEQFKGVIDDLRVYSTALSTTTIQQLYTNGFLNPNK